MFDEVLGLVRSQRKIEELEKKVKDLEDKIDYHEWALAMERFPTSYLSQPECKRIAAKRGFKIRSNSEG